MIYVGQQNIVDCVWFDAQAIVYNQSKLFSIKRQQINTLLPGLLFLLSLCALSFHFHLFFWHPSLNCHMQTLLWVCGGCQILFCYIRIGVLLLFALNVIGPQRFCQSPWRSQLMAVNIFLWGFWQEQMPDTCTKPVDMWFRSLWMSPGCDVSTIFVVCHYKILFLFCICLSWFPLNKYSGINIKAQSINIYVCS